MLYPVDSPEKWAKRYGLTPKRQGCSNCGKMLEKKIPYAYERVRGLRSKHECGDQFDHFVSVELDPKTPEIFLEFKRGFK